jgi:F-type H+-transporting ATPase subunit epsilon
MSNRLIEVNIASRKGFIYNSKAEVVSLRGDEGEMSISYGHTQLLSTLPAGVVIARYKNGQDILYVSGGIVEICPDQLTMLTDIVKLAQDIDEDYTNRCYQQYCKQFDEMDKNQNKAATEDVCRAIQESEACLKAIKMMKDPGAYH